jgi:hypothetical protein
MKYAISVALVVRRGHSERVNEERRSAREERCLRHREG